MDRFAAFRIALHEQIDHAAEQAIKDILGWSRRRTHFKARSHAQKTRRLRERLHGIHKQ